MNAYLYENDEGDDNDDFDMIGLTVELRSDKRCKLRCYAPTSVGRDIIK